MSILVVDDSETMRVLLKRELRMAGWDDVEEVEDGAAALEVLAAKDVEFVLADWNMPGVGGLELLREARRRGLDSRVGFITCEASSRLRADALSAGAKFLLTKPVSYEELDWNMRLAMGLPAATDPPASHSRRSLEEVLSGLFRRDVSVSSCEPPRKDVPRCIAVYRGDMPGAASTSAVVEMTLAASFGCALARIPGRQVAEWATAHVLSGTVERNFLEVANVLAAFASPSEERYVLEGIGYRSESSAIDRHVVASEWRSCVHVDVDGYGSGRMGFIEGREGLDMN